MEITDAPAASLAPQMVRLIVAGPTQNAALILPAHDHITIAIQRSGAYYEAELLHALRGRGARGTYVDVGAHYGNHTVFMALECGADHVVAIEPNPSTYAGLCANMRENGLDDGVTALNAAVHPSWERVDVSMPVWEPDPGSPALTNTGMSRVEEAAGDGAVAAVRLDDALAGQSQIAAIKIDVEGNAIGVVESGRAIIERDRPLLVIEALRDDEQDRLIEFLTPLGYRPHGPYNWTPTWIWAAG